MSLKPMTDDELTQARSLTLDGMSKEEWQSLYTYTKNEVGTQKSKGTLAPETFGSFQKVMTAWSKWGTRGESADESAARVTDALEELLWKEHVEKGLGLKTPTFEGRLTAAGIDLPSKFYTIETGSEEVEPIPMSTGQP